MPPVSVRIQHLSGICRCGQPCWGDHHLSAIVDSVYLSEQRAAAPEHPWSRAGECCHYGANAAFAGKCARRWSPRRSAPTWLAAGPEMKKGTAQPQLRAPGQLFESAHLFEEAIAPYSSLLVILSTSWVRACGLEQARAFLSESLQRRVIGATYDPQSPDAWRFDRLTRYDAIAQDVKRRKPSRWLAVDDDPRGSWPANERAALALNSPNLGLACPVAYAQLQDSLADRFG